MNDGVFEFGISGIKNGWCYIDRIVKNVWKVTDNFIGGKDGVIFGGEEMYGWMVGVFVATNILYIRFLWCALEERVFLIEYFLYVSLYSEGIEIDFAL